MSRMRQELPPKLLDNVLALLPLHVLCRCRLVCKRWNHLIAHPEFASRHMQARRQPSLLISPKVMRFNPNALEAYREMHEQASTYQTRCRLSHLQDKAQLVVSLDRLFLVECTGVSIFIPNVRCMTTWETVVVNNIASRKQLIDVIIWEILLTLREVIKVAEAPEYAKYPRRMLDRPRMIRGNPVVAVGCGDSIVVSSLLRRRLRFDLMWKYWEELPSNRQASHERRGIFIGILILT